MTTSIGLVYDKMTDQVELQVLRDLMLLQGQWKIAVSDPQGLMDVAMLAELGIEKTDQPPELIINYKVGPDFKPAPSQIEEVRRDLCPPDNGPHLDPNEHQGYYLKPQGRDGTNLTELYLNRSHPRGNGVTDPFVVLLWG